MTVFWQNCIVCDTPLAVDEAPCACEGWTKEDIKRELGEVWCALRSAYLDERACASERCAAPSQRPMCWGEMAVTT